MSTWHDAQQEIVKLLTQALGKTSRPRMDELEIPPDASMGDLAFPCFALAKGMKRSPVEIADELAAKIAPKGMVKRLQAKGPYVNFFLSEDIFVTHLLKEIHKEKEQYGKGKPGKKRRLLVEYAQPNTLKDVHVGHLRNFFLGQTIVHLLRTMGQEVIAASYIGDLGTHVSTCLWGLKKFHPKEEPKKEERVSFLGQVYAEAVRAAGDLPEAKEEIAAINRAVEEGKGEILPLWRKTRLWSLQEIKAIFRELHLPIDVWYFESQFVKGTKKLIGRLKKQGIAVESEGALIVDLSEEKLGANVLIKSDGALLYNGRDIGLALKKEKHYHPDQSVYVIDARQSLAMQQLFATCKRMGFQKELVHVSYEFVTLKEGAMSSRKGNVIRYQDFRDAMIAFAATETEKRHPQWSKKKIQETARRLAFAAMRYSLLRQDLEKKIVFDMQEALSFDGATGPYLLYTLARIRSLLRKSSKQGKTIEAKRLTHPTEHHLLILLASYPSILFLTMQDYHVSRLAQYLYDLAKSFSEFYAEVSVLKAEDEDLMNARLALVDAVEQVLENGLGILGIESLEEM